MEIGITHLHVIYVLAGVAIILTLMHFASVIVVLRLLSLLRTRLGAELSTHNQQYECPIHAKESHHEHPPPDVGGSPCCYGVTTPLTV